MTVAGVIEYGIYAVILLTIVALVAWNELVSKPRLEQNRAALERERAAALEEWLKR